MVARDSAQVEAHISEGAAALGITPEALREHMARKAGK
jgi:predicted ArsR family transcriptional regulator